MKVTSQEKIYIPHTLSEFILPTWEGLRAAFVKKLCAE
jgi:hypothetical protein